MSECTKLVGKGAVQYKCRLQEHEGPCACPEVPSSSVMRARWEAEQLALQPKAKIKAADKVVAPAPEIVVTTTRPVDQAFMSQADRMAIAIESLRGDFGSLPLAVQSWIMGAAAQLALSQLWGAWTTVLASGGTALVLTEEDITALVPEKLRNS
jgi:hypothetical protein